MMKKILLSAFGLFSVSVTSVSVTFVSAASVDTQLTDQVDQQLYTKQMAELQQYKSQIGFHTYSGCDQYNSLLQDMIKNINQPPIYYYSRGGGVMPMKSTAMEDSSAGAVSNNATQTATPPSPQGGADFSQTNIQVEGVDEPERLKTDGKYLYYVNMTQRKIVITKAPQTVNLSDAEVVKAIKIPESFSDAQIFLSNNKLIIIGQRYNQRVFEMPVYLDRSERTTVVIYDVSDLNNLKLERLLDLDGYYQDARLIGSDLYVVHQFNLNFYGIYPMPYYGGGIMAPQAGGSATGSGSTQPSVNVVSSKVLPTALDIRPDNTRPEKISLARNTLSCDNLLMIVPTDLGIRKYFMSPSFTLLTHVNVSDTSSSLQTTALLGYAGTVYMTQKALYLAQSTPFPSTASCMYDGQCQGTVVHKFNLSAEKNLIYKGAAVVYGEPLNQRSMHEDDQGYTSILTKSRYPQVSTHLFVFDQSLNVVSSLMGMQPGEEFKASRYLGNYLYLVTFKQIDPLFVIDLTQKLQPKIAGELLIPGFSTYLHPYEPMANGVQYLVGIGYGISGNQRGGTVTDGIKVDLYKVDFNTLNAGKIAISQLSTKTLGSKGSYAEAVQDPRVFTWDPVRKLLLLAVNENSEQQTQYCTIQYDSYGKEISKSCYPQTSYVNAFAGVRGLSIDKNTGISNAFSVDYKDLFKDTSSDYNYVDFSSYPIRAGYIGNIYYSLNDGFTHFYSAANLSGSYAK